MQNSACVVLDAPLQEWGAFHSCPFVSTGPIRPEIAVQLTQSTDGCLRHFFCTRSLASGRGLLPKHNMAGFGRHARSQVQFQSKTRPGRVDRARAMKLRPLFFNLLERSANAFFRDTRVGTSGRRGKTVRAIPGAARR